MLSALLVGLVLGNAVTTAASPIDLTTRDDGITCTSAPYKPFDASYDDCMNEYNRLRDSGGIAVDIGEKGHRDWLMSDSVQVVSGSSYMYLSFG